MAKLFVGNLAYSCSSEMLRSYFERWGEVASAALIMDRATGRSKGFGFVEYEDPTAAASAVARADGSELAGRRLTVSLAKPARDFAHAWPNRMPIQAGAGEELSLAVLPLGRGLRAAAFGRGDVLTDPNTGSLQVLAMDKDTSELPIVQEFEDLLAVGKKASPDMARLLERAELRELTRRPSVSLQVAFRPNFSEDRTPTWLVEPLELRTPLALLPQQYSRPCTWPDGDLRGLSVGIIDAVDRVKLAQTKLVESGTELHFQDSDRFLPQAFARIGTIRVGGHLRISSSSGSKALAHGASATGLAPPQAFLQAAGGPESAARLLGIPAHQLAELTGDSLPAQRLRGIIRVVGSAAEIWDERIVATWLRSPNGFLNGSRPIDVLVLEGPVEVLGALDATAGGTFA